MTTGERYCTRCRGTGISRYVGAAGCLHCRGTGQEPMRYLEEYLERIEAKLEKLLSALEPRREPG